MTKSTKDQVLDVLTDPFWNMPSLTERERAHLRLAVRGLTLEEIAEELDTTPGAAYQVLRSAMPKVGVTNKKDLPGVVLKLIERICTT